MTRQDIDGVLKPIDADPPENAPPLRWKIVTQGVATSVRESATDTLGTADAHSADTPALPPARRR
jgi:hypothetical protein